MLVQIKKQVAYEHWANTALLAKLKEAIPLNSRALLLFSHIINANSIWISRLKNESNSVTLFQERSLAECEILINTIHKQWQELLGEIERKDLEKNIQFHFPIDNTTRSISVEDGIFHLLTHSAYHRGQIISLIKPNVETITNLAYVLFASHILE